MIDTVCPANEEQHEFENKIDQKFDLDRDFD
jgi:hypothetical protein